MPSAIMASGGVALDILWGLLPIPSMITGNAGINALAKGAGAIGLGIVVEKMGNKRTGELIAMGGLTVAIYDAMRQAVTTFAPNLTLGYTGAEWMREPCKCICPPLNLPRPQLRAVQA